MSVNLFVKLLRPMSFREIETTGSTAFRDLLNLDYDAVITADSWQTGQAVSCIRWSDFKNKSR